MKVLMLLLLLSPCLCEAQNYPKRRAGLWEIQSEAIRSAGLAPARQCVGPRTDTAQMHLDRLPGKRGVCSIGGFKSRGSAWVAESVCKRGREVITSRKIATGDFSSAYRIDTVVRHRSGKHYRPQIKGVLQARYLGPCLPGQRADDLISSGMGTLNMSDGAFKAEPRKKRRKRRQKK